MRSVRSTDQHKTIPEPAWTSAQHVTCAEATVRDVHGTRQYLSQHGHLHNTSHVQRSHLKLKDGQLYSTLTYVPWGEVGYHGPCTLMRTSEEECRKLSILSIGLEISPSACKGLFVDVGTAQSACGAT